MNTNEIPSFGYAPGNTRDIIDKMLSALSEDSANWKLDPDSDFSREYSHNDLIKHLNLFSNDHTDHTRKNIIENLIKIEILVPITFHSKSPLRKRESQQGYKIDIRKLQSYEQSASKPK